MVASIFDYRFKSLGTLPTGNFSHFLHLCRFYLFENLSSYLGSYVVFLLGPLLTSLLTFLPPGWWPSLLFKPHPYILFSTPGTIPYLPTCLVFISLSLLPFGWSMLPPFQDQFGPFQGPLFVSGAPPKFLRYTLVWPLMAAGPQYPQDLPKGDQIPPMYLYLLIKLPSLLFCSLGFCFIPWPY